MLRGLTIKCGFFLAQDIWRKLNRITVFFIYHILYVLY